MSELRFVDMSHARAVVRGREAGWLKRHGFDGLYNADGPCACEVDDLYPCGERGDCRPGVKTTFTSGESCGCGAGCDWHIGKRGSQVKPR